MDIIKSAMHAKEMSPYNAIVYSNSLNSLSVLTLKKQFKDLDSVSYGFPNTSVKSAMNSGRERPLW